ncbi:hypothetical protein [Streptosporangium sp. NPDC006930]|uniref:hypothetical protein n=1 Tax=Streptosporangium sp. NPDC006930 TaxID=3154783 RepID=UPI0034378B08
MNNGFWRQFSGWTGRYSNEYIYRTRLPSELQHANFDATIEVLGLLDRDQATQEAQVHRRLEERASAISATFSVLDLDGAAAAITIELNREQVASMPDLNVRLDGVRIRLSAGLGAVEAARSREAAIQETALAEMRAREQARRLGFMREHILASSSMARLWWLNDDPGRLVELAKISNGDEKDPFEIAVRLLSGTPEEAPERNEAASILETFVRELTPEARKYLISQLAQMLGNYERPDLAEQMLATRQFNGAL